MYYNHVRQPDGVPAIGVNLEMQPPNQINVENENENEDEDEDEGVTERIDIIFNKVAHITLFFMNFLFAFAIHNLVNIINLIFSIMCLHGISKKNMKYVYFHTIYLMSGLILSIYVSIDTYVMYYSACILLNVITIEQYS
jgi:hypothetical protein